MSSVKAEGVAYLVLKIALVRVVYQLRIIDCEKESRRVYPNLLYPVDLNTLSSMFPDYWRLMVGQGVGQHKLEVARAYQPHAF